MRRPSAPAPVTHVSLALLFGLTVATQAPAATLRVPADFPTIQAALDAATSGDEVLVGPGLWTQSSSRIFSFTDPAETRTLTAVGFVPPGVTVVSEDGAGPTTIRIEGAGTDGHCLVAALGAQIDPITIRGFRLTRALPGAAAILVRENPVGATVSVTDCAFISLDGGANQAGGVWSWNGGNVTVARCAFDDVDSPDNRGAVGAFETSFAVDHTLEVTGSGFTICDGGGVYCWTPDFVARNCTFTNCTTFGSSRGSGIRSVAATNVVEDCDFTRCENTPLSLSALGTPLESAVRRCRFVDGSGTTSGAFETSSRQLVLEDCHFEDCTGGTAGAVVVGAQVSVQARIRRNLFRGIDTETFGAIYWAGANGDLTANTFVDCSSTGSISAACAYVRTFFRPTVMARNIFASSSGIRPAVRRSLTSSAPLENDCNAYWDNAGGDTADFDPAPSAIFADPLFCAPGSGDYHLQWGSPCLPANSNGCSVVGAFGFGGCNSIGLHPESWGKTKARWRERSGGSLGSRSDP